MEEKLEYSNTEKEKEHSNENANLDESRLSVKSEINGQEECGKILKNNANIIKGGSGGYKKTYILGNNDFIKFFSIKNNNNDVFDYQQCFYYALLRTIENVKGIKFIGENIQRFAGNNLLTTCDNNQDNKTLACLCLIAFLLHQINNRDEYKEIKQCVINILHNIEGKTKQEIKDDIFSDGRNKVRRIRIKQRFLKNKQKQQLERGILQSSQVPYQSCLKPVYQHLNDTIKNIDSKGQKVINKFLCQLFFLIFFTNKLDIKPNNILVQTDNNNMEFLHIDFDESEDCKAMFATFDQHEQYNFYYGKYFLESLWNRISSNELSKYFNEYIEKYTLTEEKLKKIISRTVKNVYRQNYDINKNKQGKITAMFLKKTCRESFMRMQKYMQYMLDQLNKKEISLQDGDKQKKAKLINVLKVNHKVLSAMLKNNTIEKCVEDSIKRYKELRKKVLEEKQPKQLNKNIDNPVSNPQTHSNHGSVKSNNKSNINNELNLNNNLNHNTQKVETKGTIILNPIPNNIPNLNINNNINLNNSGKKINDRQQNIIINDNTEKNSQMTSCGGILSNIKDFFTQCCSNCETNNSADVNTYSLQVSNKRNIK